MRDGVTISGGFISITPQSPTYLAGFSSRTETHTGVGDDLEANALIITPRTGAPAVFLTLDLLYVPNDLYEAVVSFLGSRLGIGPAAILFAASHTHFAPGVCPEKHLLGKFNADYARFLRDRVLALLSNCMVGKTVPVTVSHGAGQWFGSVNRRRQRVWRLGGKIVARSRWWDTLPNPAGPVDRAVHTVTFRNATGEVEGVGWNVSCHPVGFPTRRWISADYPGFVRSHVRRALRNPFLPILFFQGFCGDIRPNTSVRVAQASPLRRVRKWCLEGSGPYFGSFSRAQYAGWCHTLASEVCRVLQSAEQKCTPALNYRLSTTPLGDLIVGAGSRSTEAVYGQRVQLCGHVQFISISAEPCAGYLEKVAQLFPGMTTIPVGYTGGVFGYLPTAAMLPEGGYEVARFFKFFGLDGSFRPDVESRIMSSLAELRW
jgi:hypothetical protein